MNAYAYAPSNVTSNATLGVIPIDTNLAAQRGLAGGQVASPGVSSHAHLRVTEVSLREAPKKNAPTQAPWDAFRGAKRRCGNNDQDTSN